MPSSAKLIPISAQAIILSDILGMNSFDSHVNALEWATTSEWLHLVASIKSVCIDVVQHEKSFGWCENADTHTMQMDRMLNESVKALTEFVFAWNALESTITNVNPPKNRDKSKRGKIRNASAFIESHFDRHSILYGYRQSLIEFLEIAEHYLDPQRLTGKLAEGSETGFAGSGLICIYELRNKFAHGALNIHEVNLEDEKSGAHFKVFQLATRITLLSIQHLLLAKFESCTETVESRWKDANGEKEYPIGKVLRECHFFVTENSSQTSLF